MKIMELYNTNSTLVKKIYDFLQNGEKQIKYSPNKDIVLLLGNTGSGKSTLTHYISGNAHTLLSQEVEEDTGEYVIVDKNNKISSTSTIVSQTIYPDLVEDAKTDALYYDCPGFSDTRSAAHEIAATYFIKKVIDSARAVKIVFVVNHHSVTKGADRQDLILLMQHAADFITQMGKFKNSIALVVTKVENRYVDGEMVSDQKVIQAIANYLEQSKRDIDEHPEMINSPDNSSDTKNKVELLLDIFLSKGENGQYTRIGIFRKPNKPGLISDIELMKDGKISLVNLINKNIQFIKPATADFGYTVSAKSKVNINELSNEINKALVKELLDIGKELEEYFIAQEEKNSDLDVFISRFQNLEDSFSKIFQNAIKDKITPDIFMNEIFNNCKDFNISIPDHHIKTVQREHDYINFLNIVTNKSIKNNKSSLLAAGLSNLTGYLSDSLLFYRFLYKMYQRLSEYEIQKNKNNYTTVRVNTFNDFFESPVFNEIEKVFKVYSSIKKMKLNTQKFKLLNRVLDQTLKYQTEIISTTTDGLIVKGVNIMLSDLRELFNNTDIKLFEVHAQYKIFIDTSLDLTGREVQMAIIAPVWEVVGSQSIILDGKPGMDHHPQKASSGHRDGDIGTDGQPGEPGGPAGNFIGIGKYFINEEYLRISADGGRGGNGQDGGNGADGFDGSQCLQSCRVSNNILFTYVYNKGDAEYGGQVGGNGGNGGIAGYGGHKGFIYMIKVGNYSEGIQVDKSALDGNLGENGKGGSGGKGGRHFKFNVRNYFGLINLENFGPTNKWAKNGESGKDGTNQQNRNNTWELTKVINITDIKNKSSEYLKSNIKNNLLQTSLTTFLSEIENSLRTITQVITKRKRRNIEKFKGNSKSEGQLRNINDPIEIKTSSYDQYVYKVKANYYKTFYHNLKNITDIKNTLPSDLSLDIERIKQTHFKPIFPISQQLETMRTKKHINLNNQYPSINLLENLLLSEMVLKKFVRKEIWFGHDYKGSPEKETKSAHDLAYRYYQGN